MKKRKDFIGILLLFIVALFFFMCTSLSEIKLKTQTFTIEEVKTETGYEADVAWSTETQRESYVESYRKRHEQTSALDIFFSKSVSDPVSTSDMKKGDVAKIRDYIFHRIELYNPINNQDYVILGQVQLYRKITKESSRSTFESTSIHYPVEFWIFREGRDIGKVVVECNTEYNHHGKGKSDV